MRHYFSPSAKTFHTEAIDGPRQIAAAQTKREIKAKKRPVMVDNPAATIPEDAVEISPAQHADLIEAQASGQQIIERGGKPVAVDWKADPEEQRAIRRDKRDRLLAESDWTQLGDSPLADELRGPWQAYRQQLRDLDMDGTDWPAAPGGAG